MVTRTAMLSELFKYVLSIVRTRAGGVLQLLRNGWKAFSDFFRHGISAALMPDLKPEERESIARLRARAMGVLKERKEKQEREHAQTQTGRTEAEAAKKASEAAQKATAQKAGAGIATGEANAPAASHEAKSAVVVREPSFGPDATIRTAAVLKLVAPVAIRALVEALAKPRPRYVEAEAEAA